IADFYCVFARTGEAPGARGISAFVVDADTPGFEISERIELIAPHPLATITFDNCRIPVSQRLGEAGQGFKLAMMTLDIFRASVAAA
ncbi:acyl-CoA dehydrogenase, partial [Campylobacter lari]|nr:acyl-CoA dehydrogenase [Campylobacter lari]